MKYSQNSLGLSSRRLMVPYVDSERKRLFMAVLQVNKFFIWEVNQTGLQIWDFSAQAAFNWLHWTQLIYNYESSLGTCYKEEENARPREKLWADEAHDLWHRKNAKRSRGYQRGDNLQILPRKAVLYWWSGQPYHSIPRFKRCNKWQ